MTIEIEIDDSYSYDNTVHDNKAHDHIAYDNTADNTVNDQYWVVTNISQYLMIYE